MQLLCFCPLVNEASNVCLSNLLSHYLLQNLIGIHVSLIIYYLEIFSIVLLGINILAKYQREIAEISAGSDASCGSIFYQRT